MHWSHPEGKVRSKNAVNFDRTFLFVGDILEKVIWES